MFLINIILVRIFILYFFRYIFFSKLTPIYHNRRGKVHKFSIFQAKTVVLSGLTEVFVVKKFKYGLTIFENGWKSKMSANFHKNQENLIIWTGLTVKGKFLLPQYKVLRLYVLILSTDRWHNAFKSPHNL